MRKSLKKEKKADKLSKNNLSEVSETSCRNDRLQPLFSFAFTTSNSNYNFNHFKHNVRDETTARKSLDELLKELSSNTWLELTRRNRKQLGGFEALTILDINFSPGNIALPGDRRVFSFRFGNADSFRMLGCRKDGCQVLYIIGYDFDFSAYDHGA